MNPENVVDSFVGANSFAHNQLFVRMNSHLQKRHDALNENNIHHQLWFPG